MSQSQAEEFVTLASPDGFEFVLPRDAACVSGTIRRMLDPESRFAEAITGRCLLENMSGAVLEAVCKYLCYSQRYKGQTDVPDPDIPPELSLELVMAADYLDV